MTAHGLLSANRNRDSRATAVHLPFVGTARCVHDVAAPPVWLFTGGDMPVSNVVYKAHAVEALARDQWRDIEWHPDQRNFVPEWSEWSGRREYEFHIFTNTLDIDVRRRDIRPSKSHTPAAATPGS